MTPFESSSHLPAEQAKSSPSPPSPEPLPDQLSKPPAGFWLRVAARLTDTLVIDCAFALLTVVVEVGHAFGLPGGVAFTLIMLGVLLLSLAYFSYYNSNGRQTLGYHLAGIQVLSESERPISWGRSFQRTLWTLVFDAALQCLLGFMDYVPVAFSRSKRAVHDLITDTYVLRVAPSRPIMLIVCSILSFLPLLLVKASLFPLQAFYIPARSMEPTLRVNDRLLVNKLCYHLRAPQFGDLIVFRAPPTALQMAGSPDAAEGETDFIKRCLGTPGDIVYAQNRRYYRNGQLLNEPYVQWKELNEDGANSYDMKIVDGKVYSRDAANNDEAGDWTLNGEPVAPAEQARISKAAPGKVPPDQFLMLGDNSGNSLDSHYWGFVPRANLVGKVMFIFWPVARMHSF